MSAALPLYPEDPISPRTWGEANVASISISPWYRCHGGRRTRTITLQIGSNVFYDHIDKLPSEPKEVSESRCKRTIERMLQGAMNLISTLEV